MKEDLIRILKKKKIHITKTRVAMLKIFRETRVALTHGQLFKNPVLKLDRTSIFRTLNLFTEKNIIHRIPATDGVNRYLLEQNPGSVHSNFICFVCKKVIPLKIVVSPKFRFTKGCIPQKTEIIVEGICGSCKSLKR